jgi:putative transcriptional regulator
VRCLTAIEELSAKEIRELRAREGVSQAILARCLNVTTNYISQLERGTKRPRGPTLKLLSLIRSKGLEAVL